jgi:hypothetical protein
MSSWTCFHCFAVKQARCGRRELLDGSCLQIFLSSVVPAVLAADADAAGVAAAPVSVADAATGETSNEALRISEAIEMLFIIQLPF